MKVIMSTGQEFTVEPAENGTWHVWRGAEDLGICRVSGLDYAAATTRMGPAYETGAIFTTHVPGVPLPEPQGKHLMIIPVDGLVVLQPEGVVESIV